jgi:small conductance mechanosensitive channel
MRMASVSGLFRFFTFCVVAALVALSVGVAVADTEAASDSSSSTRKARANDLPIVIEARELLETIARLEVEFANLKAEIKEAHETDGKAIAELQARRRLVAWMRAVEGLVENVVEQQEQGLDASKIRQATRKILWSVDRRLPTFLDDVSAESADLRETRAEASPESAIGIEQRIQGNEELLDEGVRFYIAHIEHMDQLELGSTKARAGAAQVLERRAGKLAAKLELERHKLDEQRGLEGSGAEAENSIRATQEELDRVAASLWTVCDALDDLELPTAAHRRVLILATGELTADVLDKEVLAELADAALETSRIWIEQRAPVLFGRLARFFGVLAIFWVLGGITRRLVARVVESSGEQLSTLAQRILVVSASRVVIAIGFFLALSQIGVNVTALLAGLGIVGFILGFALQETLGNFAAGAMILLYQPFDVGDVIEAAGVTGTVDRMNLVSTTILTFDNQTLIVPNSRIWGNVIRNSTAMDRRRVDLSFPLALDVNVEEAEALFDSMCRAHPAVLDDPAPAIRVHEITGAGVVFVVRPWVRTADYWSTFWDLNREAQVRLAKAGIQIAAARYKLDV